MSSEVDLSIGRGHDRGPDGRCHRPGATGENAAIEGVEVAGKTGTAELGEDITEHAWFTAFAPAGKRPELAVAVMIANGGSGGQVAAPVAKTVLEAGL